MRVRKWREIREGLREGRASNEARGGEAEREVDWMSECECECE